MRLRKLDNGDLIAPERGSPPEIPKGYCRDLGNPYVFHILLGECEHRFQVEEKLPCGRIDSIMECDLFNKAVSHLDCQKCLTEQTL